jgi:hypothetical protein
VHRILLVSSRLLLFSVAFVSLSLAQSDQVNHHNITVGIGPGIPQGTSTSYLATAPLVKLAYGYRFNRFLQADAGFQIAFRAAQNTGAVLTDLGPLQGGDHEFMIPLGGRVIIPTPLQRIELSAGGGGVYLHYSETAPSNGYYSPSCYSCTSRGGWGGYGLGNVSYFLDENHNFRVGATLQYISATTNGQAVGNVPAVRTNDHWLNLTFEFGLSF